MNPFGNVRICEVGLVPGEEMLALQERRSSHVLRVDEFCPGEGCFETSENCREGVPASGWNSGYEQASENPAAQANYADVVVVFGAFFEREFGGREFVISMSADRLPPLATICSRRRGPAVRDPTNQAGLADIDRTPGKPHKRRFCSRTASEGRPSLGITYRVPVAL